MFNSRLLSSITVAVVAALMLCTVAATLSPSVQALNGWSGGAIPGTTRPVGNYYNIVPTTSLAYTSTGDPRVAYYDRTHGDLWYMSRAGGTWSSKLVDSVGDVGEGCHLALKNNLPWISYESTNGVLKCAWMDAKNVWHYEKVDKGATASICISPLDGQPRISYSTQYSGLWFAYRTASGSWVKQQVDRNVDDIWYTSIAINPVTKGPAISYYVSLNYHALKYASKNPATSIWTCGFVDRSSTTDVGQDCSLAFTSAGEPRIAYKSMSWPDWSTNNIKYAMKAGGRWYYVTLRTAAQDGWYTSLVLSNKDLPRISSVDFWNNRVVFTWKDTSGVWHSQSVSTGTGTDFTILSTSIALYRATGKTGISYIPQWKSSSGIYTYSVNLMEKTYPFN